MDRAEVMRALEGLVPAYLGGKPADSMQGRIDFFVAGLTERGRRAVGLWPSEESVDALVDDLRKSEEATDDPEEKSLIRRAAGARLTKTQASTLAGSGERVADARDGRRDSAPGSTAGALSSGVPGNATPGSGRPWSR